MERIPQVLENVRLPSRRPLERMPQLSRAADRIGKELDGKGRVLIRWSGTEPKLRIMIEGPDEERLRAWAAELADLARHDIAAESP